MGVDYIHTHERRLVTTTAPVRLHRVPWACSLRQLMPVSTKARNGADTSSPSVEGPATPRAPAWGVAPAVKA